MTSINRKEHICYSALLIDQNLKAEAKQANNAWKEHTKLVRGNPVRIYEGIKFKAVN